MGDIVIEENNYKVFIITLAHFFALLACIAIVIYGAVYQIGICKYIGIFASFLFLVMFIKNFVKLKTPKPLLVISRDGITDSSGAVSFYIPFHDIREFQISNVFGNRVIGVTPKDSKLFLHKLSPMRQKVARERLQMQLPLFFISVATAKDMTLEDIYSLLVKRLEDYSRLYD